jgi:hypothetical protein
LFGNPELSDISNFRSSALAAASIPEQEATVRSVKGSIPNGPWSLIVRAQFDNGRFDRIQFAGVARGGAAAS